MQTPSRLKSLFLVILLCITTLSAIPAASAADKDTTLKIATYNVEWFLDAYPDPYSQSLPNIPNKPKQDIEKITRVIREMNADVVAFQEMENEGVLRQVVQEQLKDMNYKYVLVGQTNSNVGQHLGVISKKPIIAITSHRFLDLKLPEDPRSWRFSRDLLKVTLQATPDKTMDIYVVHLKSKRDSLNDKNSNAHRLAEALMAQQIIRKQLAADPAAWVILMGDFNDTPDSPPLKALTGGDQPLLLDPHASLPAEKRISYLKAPYRSTIDFTLLSTQLARRALPEKTGVLVHESTDKDSFTGSDHSPVYVTINIAPKQEVSASPKTPENQSQQK